LLDLKWPAGVEFSVDSVYTAPRFRAHQGLGQERKINWVSWLAGYKIDALRFKGLCIKYKTLSTELKIIFPHYLLVET